MDLWTLILVSKKDGLLYVFNDTERIENLIDRFCLGFVDYDDLDGIGNRIIKEYRRTKDTDGNNIYIVILSDEIDENENGYDFLQEI